LNLFNKIWRGPVFHSNFSFSTIPTLCRI